VAILREASRPNARTAAALESAARKLGLTLLFVELRRSSELDGAFATMSRNHAGAALINAAGLIHPSRQQVADLALRYRLPALHLLREYAEAGLFLTYGPTLEARWRRAATYVDRIFKGAKPGDLPVEQPTTFALVVNLKTARALGLTIPPSLLARADRVIDP
jgi:putative ABC transport system substrate-binding protein